MTLTSVMFITVWFCVSIFFVSAAYKQILQSDWHEESTLDTNDNFVF